MISSQTTKRRFVIVGGGTAGWMAANLLAHEFGQDSDITLIESSDIGVIGVGEGSTPYFVELFKKLDIPESEWMPACNATYKCGISFSGWCREPEFEEYFHPFFSQHDVAIGSEFYRNCHLRRFGYAAPVNASDFFLSAELARNGQAPHTRQPSGLSHDYSYHFDAGLLGSFLKERARSMGVKHVVDTVCEVLQHPNGDINALQTEKTGILEGEIFIDCSGFAGLLINKTLRVPFYSLKDSLFNDSAVAIPTPAEHGKLPSQTFATALSNGWAWKIPLTSRNGNGYVYASDFISADQAEQELRQHLGKDADHAEARHLKMRVGRVDTPWSHNCVAVGLAQGFIEPLEATAIALTMFTLEQFIYLYKEGSFTPKLRDTFNYNINTSFDGTRDYIILHYQLNTRDDTEYWRANRENRNISERLRVILNAWDTPTTDFNTIIKQMASGLIFPRTSWYCLLAGKGRFSSTQGRSNQPVMSAEQARKLCGQLADKFHDQREYLDLLKQEKQLSLHG